MLLAVTEQIHIFLLQLFKTMASRTMWSDETLKYALKVFEVTSKDKTFNVFQPTVF